MPTADAAGGHLEVREIVTATLRMRDYPQEGEANGAGSADIPSRGREPEAGLDGEEIVAGGAE